ncbi:EamA family transporter [Heliobacterium gestii]|uniref:EamA family transporter n=1 Tax=Heliomicrobium gestii TaxID=2699 RepID=A0A845LC61_HELGE|nr:EamA family transporter [Heliomicrobium gestii]MBM7866163.1 drug/metabolite transporter (DMT)-like permease [Heliomicrobium gestii]MZP42510.1 EamA family transporter [Heliomicrobium gestii]
MNTRHRWLGFALIALASTLWGINGTIAKLLFQRAVSPLFVVETRLFVTAVVLFTLLKRFRPRWLSLPMGRLPVVLLLGAVLGGVQFTYLFTVSQTNVATAVFLQYTSPVVLVAYLAWRGREPIGLAHLAGVALCLAGGFLMVANSLRITPVGLASGIASAFFVAAYTVAAQQAGRYLHPWACLAYGSAIGFLLWFFIAPPYTLPWPATSEEWWFLLYVALFATLIPFGLYFLSLKYLPAATVGIVSTLEPVVAALVAWLVLQEALTPGQMLGALSVIAGALVVQLRSSGSSPESGHS